MAPSRASANLFTLVYASWEPVPGHLPSRPTRCFLCSMLPGRSGSRSFNEVLCGGVKVQEGCQ